MNKKEELEHKLEQAKTDSFEINKQVQILEKQLRETEEPKLRHGDFGLNNGCPVVAITNLRKRLVMSRPGGEMDCQEANIQKCDFRNNVFGNIFDLMKDWGENLEGFVYAGVHFEMKGRVLEISIHGELMTITGLESQIEAWCKFGQMIMTLKRKEAK